MSFRKTIISLLVAGVVAPIGSAKADEHTEHDFPRDRLVGHVLLLSIDGMHALDLENYIHSHPASALSKLSQHGVRYTNASTSKPSDSFPGLLTMVTGGSPISTGVFYDDSYDRSLFAAGSDCHGTPGTEVLFDETIDNAAHDGINPSALPLDQNCNPVYPHQFVKVNTIFEVIKAHGGVTAWADKHAAYDLVNGPSGKGVDDLYTPEITIPNGLDATTSVVSTVENDTRKVDAVINEIHGLDHSGKTKRGVPSILGMNFQAVSVGQKISNDAIKHQRGGYLDAAGTPTEVLEYGLDKTDAALEKMVKALKEEGLYESTLIVVSAKHGQVPIDLNKLSKVGHLQDNIKALNTPEAATIASSFAQITEDDVALIWLRDQSQAGAVAKFLNAHQAGLHIQEVLAGESLKLKFNDPLTDTRTPDLIVIPNYGTIYTSAQKKIAEHGGFSDADVNVPLLIAHPEFHQKLIKTPVQTTQIAPTILEALGIAPEELEAVRKEHTGVLPAIQSKSE